MPRAEPIRVLYDHQIFASQQYGGVSRYFYELVKRVDADPRFSARIVAPLYVNGYLAEGGARVLGMRIRPSPRPRRWVSLVNRLALHSAMRLLRPDVVHETFFSRRPSAPRGCPVVLTVYDMIHEKFPESFPGDSSTTALKRAAVARADRIICISEHTRRDLLELFGPDPAKVKTIHLGFSMSRSGEPSEIPALPRPFFLYVGKRDGYKNFAALLRAYATTRSLRERYDLLAFGGGPFDADEVQAIRSAGIDPARVRQMGGDDALLGHLYRKAAAFVYPSRYEGFGIPLLEAMHFGCPVVCSEVSSIPEIAGEAALYFDPLDEQSIARALERVVSVEGIREGLISRGRERLAAFSYDRCAAETMDVYRELRQ